MEQFHFNERIKGSSTVIDITKSMSEWTESPAKQTQVWVIIIDVASGFFVAYRDIHLAILSILYVDVVVYSITFRYLM